MRTSSTKKSSEDRQALERVLQKNKKELASFFRTSFKRPNIIFLRSRAEIDAIWKRKTEPWMSAWANNGTIYILHPTVYAKESNHTVEHFWKTMKHEYCHLLFVKKTGINYPKW